MLMPGNQRSILPPQPAPKPTVRGYGSHAHLRGKIPDSFFFDPLPEDELKLWEGDV